MTIRYGVSKRKRGGEGKKESWVKDLLDQARES